MKRLFTFFVALICACTFSAYAAIVEGTCGDNLTWTLNTKDSTLVISGEGEMDNYTSSSVPWSEGRAYIKYVTIEDGVTTIGNYAFYWCSALTSAVLGNSVTSIGVEAFYDCSSLTEITIPNSVMSIGNYAFYNCSFTSITIPNSVITIDYYAFSSCDNLTSITIPNSVTSIRNGTFKFCSGLTSVTLGNNVTSIGEYAFYSCGKIKEVTSYASTPPTAASCGLNQSAATLYVPAEHIDTYSNALWWEDFKEIRAIDTDYVVTFFDWDDTVLAKVAVAAGEAAIAPANPTREGYIFKGWDKDFSFVTSNLDVYAQYEINGTEQDLALVFNDRDDNQVLTQTVSIIVPNAPEIEGFTFLYWQPVAAPINDVITIQAVYESNTPTAAPEIHINPANPAQKLIRNGQVYILHKDKEFTISGQIVK